MARKAIFFLAIAVAGASIWLVSRRHTHELTIRTRFHNAQGLMPEAQVRANGLEVGTVKDVRLDPGQGDQPVELLLSLYPRYAARIPEDSTATIATEGLLGPSYVEIDVSDAIGRPITNNAGLKGVDGLLAGQVFLKVLADQTTRLTQSRKNYARRSIPRVPAPKGSREFQESAPASPGLRCGAGPRLDG